MAMSYIASEGARPRACARRGKGNSDAEKQRLSHDGPNQPRLLRVHNSVRGAHLQAKELQVLEHNADYMERVRLPQMQNTCDCLLTLRHLGFGGAALGACALLHMVTPHMAPHAVCANQVTRLAAQSLRPPRRWCG